MKEAFDIATELAAFDDHQKRRDRSYWDHVDWFVRPDDRRCEAVQLDMLSGLPWIQQLSDKRLYEAVKGLSCADREALDLHVVKGLPLSIVAAEMRVSYAAAQRRYHRALGKLRISYFGTKSGQ